jgi:copper chaperone CopZ
MARATTETLTVTVTGMHCASCGILIDEAVEDLDGVTSSTTSVRAGRTTVVLDPTRCDPQAVLAAVADAGYTATLETP